MTCRTRRNPARALAGRLGSLIPAEEQDARKLEARIAELSIGIARYRAAGDAEAAEPLAQECCDLRAKASDLRVRLRERRERGE